MKRLVNLLIITHIVAFAYAQPGKVGVMIMAHGANPQWNQLVIDASRPVASKYPTEIAFGMASPKSMQEAIDNLESKGVRHIIVVPLFISSHSLIIRQSEYLLGLREELADPPLLMDHGVQGKAGSGTTASANTSLAMDPNHGTNQSESILPRLRIQSTIRFTKPLDDHPLVAEILYQRIEALSTDPTREIVLLVGHGPNPEEDNKNWVRGMESLADQVRALQQRSGRVSKMLLAITVRDDADPAVYNQARENLRNLVVQGSKQGDVLVIPVFLSSGSAEQKVVKRLDGLTYKWNGHTLLPDPKISEFISMSVAEALK